LKLAGLLLAATLASGEASAHGPRIGVHGGPQTMAGVYHIEIVTNDKKVTVYLMDHAFGAVSTTGFKGVAAPSGDKSEDIALTPAGENVMTGTASTPLAAEFKGVLRITAPSGATTQAKF
jgi:hypothetical protein